jgi:hypothetical protein
MRDDERFVHEEVQELVRGVCTHRGAEVSDRATRQTRCLGLGKARGGVFADGNRTNVLPLPPRAMHCCLSAAPDVHKHPQYQRTRATTGCSTHPSATCGGAQGLWPTPLPRLPQLCSHAHGQRRRKIVDVTITHTHTHTHACWRIAQRESHRPVRLYLNHVARPHRASKVRASNMIQESSFSFDPAILGPELAGGVCARGCRASLCAGSAALLALPRWRRIALRTNGGRPTHT